MVYKNGSPLNSNAEIQQAEQWPLTGILSTPNENLMVNSYNLDQNYPNPFNPGTVISYQLPVSCEVVLKVFDILGNEVTTLVNEEKPAASYEVKFDASGLSSGGYMYKLQAGAFIETKKMILLR